MTHHVKSVRAFIGSKDFDLSRSFYKHLGFTEVTLGSTMSYFKITDTLGFYLQNAYVKQWVDNTMIFVEVENVEQQYNDLLQLGLGEKYEGARLEPIKYEAWGSECFLHDPAGVLWHFGAFTK